jgi:HD-GYP domain-containing protein (c-di-GMP phosphodiesterase class II)
MGKMRKLMMAVAAVASLGLAAGCQNNKDKVQAERQDVAEAQREANKTVAEARQEGAQERTEVARDEQEKIAEAQKDVAEEQKDVAEAEREALNDRNDDLNRDNDLRDDSAIGGAGMAGVNDDKNKDVNKDVKPIGALQTVEGTLTSSLGNSLKLRDANGKELSLEIDKGTRVMHNGKAVKLDNFKEGTKVRASYVQDEDQDNVARDVTITSPVAK